MEQNRIAARSYIFSRKCILFDMDGTLYNTEGLHATATSKALKTVGKDVSAELIKERYFGWTDTNVFTEILGNDRLSDHLTGVKNDMMVQIIRDLGPIGLGKLETAGMLNFLKVIKSKGILTGLISASEARVVNAIVETCDLNELFDLVLPRQKNLSPKPSPEPYLFAMQKLKVKSSETLIFEDSPTGLASATSSKAAVLRITDNNNVQDTFYKGVSVANFNWQNFPILN